MSIKRQPIGIFDSGLGGLTVFTALRRLLPNENLIYFGDTARVPYGAKSKSAVISFSKEISGYLLLKKVKMLVVACNTVSSLALGEIRRLTNIPVIGVIEPGVKAALGATPAGGKILVIGTKATIASHAYAKALLQREKNIKVLEQACPLFVPLVEEGWTEKGITADAALEYLSKYKSKKINTLILGCTHYPLMEKTVRRIVGDEVNIVNSALATAYSVKQALVENNILSDVKNKGTEKFIVSDSPEHFSDMAYKLLKLKTKNITVKRF